MSRLQRVRGTCPACGVQDLALTRAGYVVCCDPDCPRNTAAFEIADRISPPMPIGRYLVTRPLERGPLVFTRYGQQEQS